MRYTPFKLAALCALLALLWMCGFCLTLEIVSPHTIPAPGRNWRFWAGLTGLGAVSAAILYLLLYKGFLALQYRRLYLHHPIPMWIYEKGTLRFLSVNEAAITTYGYTEKEFLQMTIKDIREPAEVSRLLENVRLRCAGDTYRGTWRHRRKNGENFYAEIYAHPGYYMGRHVRIIMARDVDQQVKAARAARELNARYRLLAKVTNDAIYDWDIGSDKIKWNRGVYRLFGYTPEKVSDSLEWWMSRIHPDDRPRLQRNLEAHLGQAQPQLQEEYRFLCANGSYKYVLDRGYLIREDGAPPRLVGVIQDIDQRVKQAREIRLLSLVASKTQNAVAITNGQEAIEWVNDGFTRQFGFTLAEVSNKKLHDFLSSDVPPLTGLPLSTELLAHHRNGHSCWVKMDVSPVTNAAGETEKYVIIITDITEKKRIIQQLQEQNRALREIAWINSHEIRRPVVSILSIAQLFDKSNGDIALNSRLMEWLYETTAQLDEVIHKIEHKVKAMQQ